jgi:hypothetical protein
MTQEYQSLDTLGDHTGCLAILLGSTAYECLCRVSWKSLKLVGRETGIIDILLEETSEPQ